MPLTARGAAPSCAVVAERINLKITALARSAYASRVPRIHVHRATVASRAIIIDTK
jgi:hypothetical protein